MPEQFFLRKKGQCVPCKAETRFVLHRQFTGSGAESFVWVCGACQTRNPDRSPRHFISREQVKNHVTDEQIENLPTIMPRLSNRCAKCGNRGTELHHWAPRAIFGTDADNWPTDYLCKDCHDHWQRV